MRGGLLFTSLLLLTWVPPLWASPQTAGLVNEILGVAGAPASWGAVAPPFSGPVALVLRFALGFAMLGVFVLALALWPKVTLNRIDPTASAVSAGRRLWAENGTGGRTAPDREGLDRPPIAPELGGSHGPRNAPARAVAVPGARPSDSRIRVVETEGP